MFSSAVPAGMSIETRNVFLFAFGSMRNFTHCMSGKVMEIRNMPIMMLMNSLRLPGFSSSGPRIFL